MIFSCESLVLYPLSNQDAVRTFLDHIRNAFLISYFHKSSTTFLIKLYIIVSSFPSNITKLSHSETEFQLTQASTSKSFIDGKTNPSKTANPSWSEFHSSNFPTTFSKSFSTSFINESQSTLSTVSLVLHFFL